MTLKIRPRSSKSIQFFPLSQWCFCTSLIKIHPWLDKKQSADKAHSYSLNSVVTLKTIPIIQFRKFGQNSSFCSRDKHFWSKFDIQKAGMTLKMRLMSPKSNHFFPLSQWCFCACFIKIHLLVQEIEYRQGSFLQSL